MAFNLSFAGVRLSITPCGNSVSSFLSSVRHCDGRIEADVVNFSGTITLSDEAFRTIKDHIVQLESNEEKKYNPYDDNDLSGGGAKEKSEAIDSSIIAAVEKPEEEDVNGTSMLDQSCKSAVSVDAILETDPRNIPFDNLPFLKQSGGLGGYNGHNKIQDPYYPQSESMTGSIYDADSVGPYPEPDLEMNHFNANGAVQNIDTMINQDLTADLSQLSFHDACASEDVNIDNLRAMLKRNPAVASVQNKLGDYPAHIFANNDAIIYGAESDYDVVEFLFELYCAFPGAFFTEGSSFQIPFACAIVDWIDSCHQIYKRDAEGVYRISELRTLSRSDRIENSRCVRAEVQMLTKVPDRVTLTPKAAYSFKMLSLLLDKLRDAAFENISQRKEFYLATWKRRNKIIRSIASIPFLIRTILLIECPIERGALLELPVVKSASFSVESVGLWIVALLAGDDRSRNCAMSYLDTISRSSISDLYGQDRLWSHDDVRRFHTGRKQLYNKISKLGGLLPIMLRLGDRLYELSLKRPVKHIVEHELGTPLVVYNNFSELVCMLILVCTFRIIIELLNNSPEQAESYQELWGLALTTAVFFTIKDLGIIVGFMAFDFRLLKRHLSHVSTMVEWLTSISVITTLSMMYKDHSIHGSSYLGVVAGLLWWKLLLHLKGMSSNLSTLIYTILMISGSLKYFLLVFFILILGFSDMIQIVTKTSGQCDGSDPDFETMCSLTPVQSYVAMYGAMIGGVEMSAIGNFSPLVIMIFIFATFAGMIVLVNILIAIVTSEYENACEQSRALFARARLEEAAKHNARMRITFPPNPTCDMGLFIWSFIWVFMYISLFVCQEYYMIYSLFGVNSLRKEGVIDGSYFVFLVIYAVMHHAFFVACAMSLISTAIKRYTCLAWLKGTKFHKFLSISYLPVCYYLRSVGLSASEECTECEGNADEQPLKRKDFLDKEEELERKIKDAIRESEQRILSFSM